MVGAAVAQHPGGAGAEAAEHDSQNCYPVRRPGQRFRTQCAR